MKSLPRSTLSSLLAQMALLVASLGTSALTLAVAPTQLRADPSQCNSGGCWVAGMGGNGICAANSGTCLCCDMVGRYCVPADLCIPSS